MNVLKSLWVALDGQKTKLGSFFVLIAMLINSQYPDVANIVGGTGVILGSGGTLHILYKIFVDFMGNIRDGKIPVGDSPDKPKVTA